MYYMKNKVHHLAILGLCCLNVLALAVPFNEQDAMEKCMERTGLQRGEITKYIPRNQNCAIDCTTRQGTVLSYFVGKDYKCLPEDGYRCVLGKCRNQEEIDSMRLPPLYQLDIFIRSAKVPDMDYLPTAGGSDVFVVVQVEQNGDPIYDDGELVCYTYVIQDNNQPRWRNFSCRPLPMALTTSLKFTAYDSDKPIQIHDVLGYATSSVEYLLNRGPTRLTLNKGSRSSSNYYVEVEIKAKPTPEEILI